MFGFKKKQGITAEEVSHIRELLAIEYDLASERQKEGTKKPSGYMKGLRAAMEIVADFKPHAL